MLSEEEKQTRDLVNRCISFADKKGGLDTSRVRACNLLELACDSNGLAIRCRLTSVGHAPMRYEMSVRRNGEIVLEAHGTYSGGAMDATKDRYVAGEWEREVE